MLITAAHTYRTTYFLIFLCCSIFAKGQDTLWITKGKIYLFDDLVYDPGSSAFNLEETDLKQLTRIGIIMKRTPAMKIRIEAHTDVTGNPRLNVRLSEERAERVKSYLVGIGVERSNIKSVGFGGTRPLFERPQKPQEHARNRRIEIRITDLPDSIPVVRNVPTDSAGAKARQLESGMAHDPPKQLKKFALIIGNADYKEFGKLKNPGNDADLINHTLKQLGFETFTHKNLDHAHMIEALRAFTPRIETADIVFVYYAGHGLQYQGNNYLLPVDAKLKNGPIDLSFEAVRVDMIFNVMEFNNKQSLNMIILDACRNSPFNTLTRSSGSGLAEIKPPSGSLIAYATSPGAVAFDGIGSNGIYTEALCEELLKPQRIEDVFMNTRLKVEQKTEGVQSPWELFRLRAAYQLR